MPRIAGVDVPKDKHIEIALTYIYGLGKNAARDILKKANIDFRKLADKLDDQEVSRITAVIQKDYKIEGDLKRETQENIRRLKDIRSYRGLRHIKGLPVRGQQTQTNARTRKGPKRTVGSKKGKKK